MGLLDEQSQPLQSLLEHFAFDEARFSAQQADVAAKRISAETNVVGGVVGAPPPDSWPDLPRSSTSEGRALAEVGEDAIRNGEVGTIILNGGMATRFGGVTKGVVEALPGRSFLELKVHDAARAARAGGGRIRVFIMNSFATDEDTRAHFAEHQDFGLAGEDLEFFAQGISLRMLPDGSLFLDEKGEPSLHGPGHGDCPIFFRKSGALGRFLDSGGKHLFISNVDNLAARLDPMVIGAHVTAGKQLTAEVAPKWQGDQGGAPVLVDGKLWVVEGFRFPESFDQDAVPVFNTNTFTVDAKALDRDFDLTPCYVEKEADGKPVVQIETLIGELTRFLTTHYLRVQRTGARSRFFPIKTPQDLDDAQEDLEQLCG